MRTGKRILVVDDAKTMTDIVFRILKDAKYADVDCFMTAPVRSRHSVKRNTILSSLTGKWSQSAE